MGRAKASDATGPHLTDRQRKILHAIEGSVQASGYPPTMREIGDAVGLASTSSVAYQLSALDVENGDIVAAMLKDDTSADGQATVKTFKKTDEHVWLIPQNSAYTPIVGDEAKILGKVVAVLRRV